MNVLSISWACEEKFKSLCLYAQYSLRQSLLHFSVPINVVVQSSNTMAHVADKRDDCFKLSSWTGAIMSNSRPKDNVRISKLTDLEAVPSGTARLTGPLFGKASGSQSQIACGNTPTTQVSSKPFCFFLLCLFFDNACQLEPWLDYMTKELRLQFSLKIKLYRGGTLNLLYIYVWLTAYILSLFQFLDSSNILCTVMGHSDLRRSTCLGCFHLNDDWLQVITKTKSTETTTVLYTYHVNFVMKVCLGSMSFIIHGCYLCISDLFLYLLVGIYETNLRLLRKSTLTPWQILKVY